VRIHKNNEAHMTAHRAPGVTRQVDLTGFRELQYGCVAVPHPRDWCRGWLCDKGPIAYAGNYQQRPTPRGGNIIKRNWWQLWREPQFPSLEYIVASLDTAFTDKKSNDQSALTVWGLLGKQRRG
jgi:hypothetical protein